ncbi:siderophore-interacting protein [Actinoplanes sp. NPDC051513]|uniref:siderophore-interacting protein n=1 Tax=Actinoplanes sp. NPDC051513 TaxID=3363908 RepID=UPI003788F5E3
MWHDDLVRRFADACRRGDTEGLRAILDPDAAAVCDSGGTLPALGPIRGADGVARLAIALLGERPGAELTAEAVNGRTGLALRRTGRALAVAALDTTSAGITAVLIVLNPAKLRAWHAAGG